jgi:hypothetical protein
MKSWIPVLESATELARQGDNPDEWTPLVFELRSYVGSRQGVLLPGERAAILNFVRAIQGHVGSAGGQVWITCLELLYWIRELSELDRVHLCDIWLGSSNESMLTPEMVAAHLAHRGSSPTVMKIIEDRDENWVARFLSASDFRRVRP